MNYKINDANKSNVKIVASQNILPGRYIGKYITNKPVDKRCRYLYQEHMSQKWWETSDLGRYCNHSIVPNTHIIFVGSVLELFTNKEILADEEILVDYRKVTEFIGYIPEINF